MKRFFSLVFYCITLTLITLFLGFVAGAWSIRHIDRGGSRVPLSLYKSIDAIASLPGWIRDASDTFFSLATGKSSALLIPESVWNDGSRINFFPSKADLGYLLFSGVDRDGVQSHVKLIKVASGEEVAQWTLDWKSILSQIGFDKWDKGSRQRMMAGNPVLLHDGSIIFNAGGAMIRQSPCDQKPLWVLDGNFHHSNELAPDGTIWAPATIRGLPQGYDHPWLNSRMSDDALVNVNLEGKILRKISFSGILRDNGLEYLLFGFSGLSGNIDPIHLNQITPSFFNGIKWKIGDLLISARHLSSIFLYRPETNKIIWHKTGPWKNQHSVRFIDKRSISVFDNNVIGGSISLSSPPFSNKQQINRVIFYDISTDIISEPFVQALESVRSRTVTGGIAQVISGNRLFIEETNYGRHMVLNPQSMEWSRLNSLGWGNYLGAVSWSRYIEADLGDRMALLLKRACHQKGDSD